MYLMNIFVVLQPYIFLGVFHYFSHHGCPASQNFNPRLSFNYFNQAIILRVWLGMKATKIGYFGHLNFFFGTKICLNELIFHPQTEEKIFRHLVLYKQKKLIKYIGRKLSFKIFAPKMSSTLRPRIFILDFLQIYLIKFISFIKKNVLVLFSAICA